MNETEMSEMMVNNMDVISQPDPMVSFIIFTVFVGTYILYSYLQGMIGKKLGEDKHWGWYAIPIYNYVLLLRASGQSMWMILGLFLPYVSIIVLGVMFGRIASKLGKGSVSSFMYGLFSVLFLIFTIPMLALTKSEK